MSEGESVKGVGILLSKDIAVIVPLLIGKPSQTVPPAKQK
jgi:hypothetical protein